MNAFGCRAGQADESDHQLIAFGLLGTGRDETSNAHREFQEGRSSCHRFPMT